MNSGKVPSGPDLQVGQYVFCFTWPGQELLPFCLDKLRNEEGKGRSLVTDITAFHQACPSYYWQYYSLLGPGEIVQGKGCLALVVFFDPNEPSILIRGLG